MTTAVDVRKKETDNKMDDDNDDLMFVLTMTKPHNSCAVLNKIYLY